MRTVTFEAALLADSVQKAARVAPTKGEAFDKAAGILFKVKDAQVEVISTNLQVTFRQHIRPSSLDGIPPGEEVTWRISSRLLANFLRALPLGTGSMVSFIDKGDSSIRIKAGRTFARIPLIDLEFPSIPRVDRDGMLDANDFAAKAASVSWANDSKALGVLAGVHINGTHLICTDKYKLAMIPCAMPVDEPITVSMGPLAALLKSASDVRLAARGERLHMVLDAETEVTSIIYGENFPNHEVVSKWAATHVGTVHVPRDLLLDTLQRMMTVIESDSTPHLTIKVNGADKVFSFWMTTPNGEAVQDEVDFMGDFEGEATLGVDPNLMMEPLRNSRQERMMVGFGHEDPKLTEKVPILMADTTGFQSFLSPKRDVRSKGNAG